VGGGLDPSYEALVGLDVDVVLMTVAREAAAMEGRLETLGIRMVTLPTNTVDDVYAAIDRIGTLIDRERAADSLAAGIRAGLASLEAELADTEPVDVLYVVWSDPPMTSGGGTFVDELIRRAGGRNVFDDAPAEWPAVGFESIVARDPEVVIWPRGEDGAGTVERIRAMPGWRDVPAVQAGHVVFIDAASFNQPGPGLVDSARRLAEALHPEAF
jgi:iron complex transport system substrate-binding protein